MRLWSFHPRYLDAKGLVAAWRESLLAEAVLEGRTRGYLNHPQLARFKRSRDPLACIDCYLRGLYAEALRRGFSFDAGKLSAAPRRASLSVARGQLAFELAHLLGKLRARDPARYADLKDLRDPEPHPLFSVVDGDIEEWEVLRSAGPG